MAINKVVQHHASYVVKTAEASTRASQLNKIRQDYLAVRNSLTPESQEQFNAFLLKHKPFQAKLNQLFDLAKAKDNKTVAQAKADLPVVEAKPKKPAAPPKPSSSRPRSSAKKPKPKPAQKQLARSSSRKKTQAFKRAQQLRSHSQEYLNARNLLGEDTVLLPQDKAVTEASLWGMEGYVDKDGFRRLSKDEQQGLRYYVDGGLHRNVNRVLRGLSTVDEFGRPEKLTDSTMRRLQDQIDTLVGIMDKVADCNAGVQSLYRGEVLESVKQLRKPGDKYAATALVSTSLDRKVAEEFAQPDEGHFAYSKKTVSVLQQIEIPEQADLKGVFVPGLMWQYNSSNSGAMPISPNILREEEMLLHPDTLFEVISNTKHKTDDGREVILQKVRVVDS